MTKEQVEKMIKDLEDRANSGRAISLSSSEAKELFKYIKGLK